MEKHSKRTGIMGGTFNPIHVGHLLLAETARENYILDEVLFIPSGCPYMKENSEIADKHLRLAMTGLAISDNPYFVLSEIEVERKGNTYTFETLLTLTEQEPDTEFYFILGADSLFSLESWKNISTIFKHCIILAAVRNDKNQDELEMQIEYLRQKYQAHIKILPLKEITISSTDIRNKIKQNKSVRYMVPDKVIEYIEKHHLYGREV